MVYVKFRQADGRPAASWAPFGNVHSFTITKLGVALFEKDGKLFIHYENNRLAEVSDHEQIITLEKFSRNGIDYDGWVTQPARDALGRLIP